MNYFEKLASANRGIVLLGETGSGKTELSISAALALGRHRPVAFFDMDQSKPLFRSREAAAQLAEHSIAVYHAAPALDIPVVPGGAAAALEGGSRFPVFDAGGGIPGARMMGQFLRGRHEQSLAAIYALNPYRPQSRTATGIARALERTIESCGAVQVHIVLNPNKGLSTTLEDVAQGAYTGAAILGELGLQAEALAVREDLYHPGRLSGWADIVCVRPVIPGFYGIIPE